MPQDHKTELALAREQIAQLTETLRANERAAFEKAEAEAKAAAEAAEAKRKADAEAEYGAAIEKARRGAWVEYLIRTTPDHKLAATNLQPAWFDGEINSRKPGEWPPGVSADDFPHLRPAITSTQTTQAIAEGTTLAHRLLAKALGK